MLHGASLYLRAQEISTSRYAQAGSALPEERQTSGRVLYTMKSPITRSVSLTPMETSVFRGEMEIPDTDAYTFISAHHKLVWEAVVHIDIPTWPDWERSFPLIVWPEVVDGVPEEDLESVTAEVPEELPEGVWEAAAKEAPEEVWKEISALASTGGKDPVEPTPEKWLPWDEARDFAAQAGILGGDERIPVVGEEAESLASEIRDLWEDAEVEGPEDVGEGRGQVPVEEGALETSPGEQEVVEVPPEEQAVAAHTESGSESGPAPGSGQALEDAVREIWAEKIIGGDRDRLIRGLLGQRFSFELTVKRIDRTLGMYSEPDFKDGRTVTGTVVGADIEVSVLYPNALNGEVDSFELGADLPVWGVVSDWDSLRKQPTLRVDKA
jgi:hypothetical protein